jgi:hypothetical protein
LVQCRMLMWEEGILRLQAPGGGCLRGRRVGYCGLCVLFFYDQ